MSLPKIVLDTILEDKPGIKLKRSLGLMKYKFVWIRKIINLSLPIYIVSYNSRYPSTYLSRNELDKADSSTIRKMKTTSGKYRFKDFSMTPAIDLNEFEGRFKSGAIIMTQDLGGENFIDHNFYECAIKK